MDFYLSSGKKPQLKAAYSAQIHSWRNELLAGVASYYAGLIQAKDNLTGRHSMQVAAQMADFASYMGFAAEEVFTAYLTGLLHDLGKLCIPEDILVKPAKLTPEELVKMQQHPVMGADILVPINGFEIIAHAVRHHHEKYDGTGYPDRLSGENIPLLSRMLALCDSFDAMTSTRYYRMVYTAAQAIEEIELGEGGQFDPELSKTFVANIIKNM